MASPYARTYVSGDAPSILDSNDTVRMLIEEHLPGQLCCIGYAFVSQDTIAGQAWSEETFMAMLTLFGWPPEAQAATVSTPIDDASESQETPCHASAGQGI